MKLFVHDYFYIPVTCYLNRNDKCNFLTLKICCYYFKEKKKKNKPSQRKILMTWIFTNIKIKI